MLKQLKISHKIYLQGSIQLLLVLVMGAIAITQMAKLGTRIVEIAEEDIPLTRIITKVTEYQLEQAKYLERVFFKAALASQGDAAAQNEMRKNMDLVSEYQGKTEQKLQEAAAFTQKALGELHEQQAVAEYRKVQGMIKQVQKDFLDLKRESASAISLAVNGQLNAMITQAKVVEGIEDKVDAEVISMLDVIQDFTQQSAYEAEAEEMHAIKLIIITFVVSLIIAIVLPLIISRAIISPIKNLLSRLREVADGDGDLRMRLDESCKDETGQVAQAFNRFMEILNKVIRGVAEQAAELGTSSEECLRAMESMQKNVEVQHRETDMVATAVEEMSANTQEVARSTSDASQLAETVRDKVKGGHQTALDTQDIIQQLAGQVQDASDVIQNLVAETDNIGTVTDTIQSIAEQTNLLALNAAIEAARAGESGRGFAVVADEVRSLAQRTRESTVNIQELVQRLQAESANAVESMARGKESTEVCLEKGDKTAQAFSDAASAVNQITDLNTQVAAASEQQAMVSQEINQTLLNITQIAEETALGAKQTTIANESIAKRLIDLHTNINRFQTN